MNIASSIAIFVFCGCVILLLSIQFRNLLFKNNLLTRKIENLEGRMRAIFDNAPAEIYLKDHDGRYVMINPHFEKLFGVKNEDVVGLLPTDIHDPELGAKTRAHDLLVLKQQKTVVRDELALTKTGERTLHTIKFPTFNNRRIERYRCDCIGRYRSSKHRAKSQTGPKNGSDWAPNRGHCS